MMHEAVDYNALSWVRQEIDVTLRQARAVLLEYSADKDRAGLLEECAELMHQVRGPLQIAELAGADLLAAEMEAVLAGWQGIDIARQDRSLELLLQSMQLLPAYLSRLESSIDDSPELLFPQVTMLREVHAAGSEAAAIPGNGMQVALPAGVFHGRTGGSAEAVAARARSARVQFQGALLTWYRGGPGSAGIQTLAEVLEEMRAAAASESEARLWWVGAGVADALHAGLLEDSREIKQLFGQLDRQIKRLVDSGDVDFDDAQTETLLEGLLDCISGIDAGEGRLAAIVSTFGSTASELNQDGGFSMSSQPDMAGHDAWRTISDIGTVAVADQLDIDLNGAGGLMAAGPAEQEDSVTADYAPDAGQHFEEALRGLSLVKETIEDHLKGAGNDSPLPSVPGVLERIGREIRDAGLEREAGVVAAVQEFVTREMLESAQRPDTCRLERLADAICSIEFYLEGLRDGRIFGNRIVELAEASVAELGYPVPEHVEPVGHPVCVELDGIPDEIPQGIAGEACDAAVIVSALQVVDPDADSEILEIFFEESDTELQRLRELVSRLEPGSTSGDLLEEISRGFHTLKGNSRMLGAHALGEFAFVLENLADNTLNMGVPVDSALADLLRQACEALSQLVNQVKDAGSEPDIDVDALASEAARMSRAMAVDTTASIEVQYQDAAEASVFGNTDSDFPSVPEEYPVLAADADTEIVEIYIEEANEEIAVLSDIIPAWVAAPEESDRISDIRRIMHTLKGSGRMAGAMYMGEFAWAMEDLLNRMIDGTIRPDDTLCSLVSRLPTVLQQLIDQVRDGTEPTENISVLMNEAAALRSRVSDESPAGDTELPEVDESEEAAAISIPARDVSDLPGQDRLEMDASLLQIYTWECQEIIHTVREYLDEDSESRMVTEPLYRGLHTLSGISESAEADCVGRLAVGLDRYFSNLYHMQSQMPSGALEVLRDSCDAIEVLIDNIPDTPGDTTSIDILCERIAALDSEGEPTAAPVFDTDEGLQASTQSVSQVPDAGGAEDGDILQARQEDNFPDVDLELFDIFLEEAAEILDASERVLHAWADDPGCQDSLIEYQRHLHTLKGSARMMNITAIGDLSHALETLMTRVAEKTLSPSTSLISGLFVAQDRLSEMLEQVRKRHMPESCADLEAELEQLAHISSTMPEGDAGAIGRDDVETTCDTTSTVEESDAVPRESAGNMDVAETVEVPEEANESAAEIEFTGELHELDETLRVTVEHQEMDPKSTVEPAVHDPVPPVHEEFSIPLRSSGEPFPARKRKPARKRGELVKVQSELLDDLVNYAGEINIYRARMETQIGDYRFNLGELEQTINRLRGQLRKLEMETEAQVLYRYGQEVEGNNQDFDPLELDRYSILQESSRSLMESISDLYSLLSLMENTTRDSETLLLQQSRVSTDLQEGLMHTRMTPFAGLETRLRRIVRQSARQLDKMVNLELQGADGEMDRAVIERIIAPLEHMLRNSVAHGIENPADRVRKGKDESGSITIAFDRDGPDIVLRIADDGAGMDVVAIREKAIERGLLDPGIDMPDSDVTQFVLQTGFTTASEVTQISGRGVGLDVVNSEVKQLGGSLHIESVRDSGTVFTIRLPYTLAINRALLVRAGADTYCVPIGNVEGVVRVHPEELLAAYSADEPVYEYAGNQYQLKHLATLLNTRLQEPERVTARAPVLLMRIGDKRIALHVEALLGNREIVIKPVGMQLSDIDGISGATILGDGGVVMILDVFALSRSNTRTHVPVMMPVVQDEKRLVVMVVDDSITVRKVTARLLERNGYLVLTARDGVDATGQLQGCTPDIMLLDIEMPRMDGFELATHMRNDERLRHVPVIMITSRTGDKHRERARQIGVNHYLGKPYQENDLLGTIDRIIRGDPESTVMNQAGT